MIDLTQDAEWRNLLVATRQLPTGAERTAFYRCVRSGTFTPLIRGAYLPTDVWAALDRHARYRALLHAVALITEGAVFSHQSAAALWRLPWVGRWPDRAHAVSAAKGGGQSTRFILRHTERLPCHYEHIDSLTVTPLARTVIDIASTSRFGQAVTVADAALRRTQHPHVGIPRTSVTREDLRNEVRLLAHTHGGAKAGAVVEFANGLADRPGESMSRVSMLRAGLPLPELQRVLRGASGRVWTVDFWWPGWGLIGEFDGKWKYTDPQFLNGRTPHQVLLDEKAREDDLRAAGFGFVRWDWAVAISPVRLRDRLQPFGLR